MCTRFNWQLKEEGGREGGREGSSDSFETSHGGNPVIEWTGLDDHSFEFRSDWMIIALGITVSKVVAGAPKIPNPAKLDCVSDPASQIEQ